MFKKEKKDIYIHVQFEIYNSITNCIHSNYVNWYIKSKKFHAIKKEVNNFTDGLTLKKYDDYNRDFFYIQPSHYEIKSKIVEKVKLTDKEYMECTTNGRY